MANQHNSGAFSVWKSVAGTDTKVGILFAWVSGSTVYEWVASVNNGAFSIPFDAAEVTIKTNDVAFNPNGASSSAVETEVESWLTTNYGSNWTRKKKYQCSGYTWT